MTPGKATFIQLLTDLVYGAQTRHCARRSASAGSKTYRYLFSRASRMPLLATAGAHHGCEVPYVFGIENKSWDDWDHELGDIMRQYWVNFAANGNPNGPGLPNWPNYDLAGEPTLELGDTISVLERYRDGQLDTIDQYFRSLAPATDAIRSGK